MPRRRRLPRRVAGPNALDNRSSCKQFDAETLPAGNLAKPKMLMIHATGILVLTTLIAPGLAIC